MLIRPAVPEDLPALSPIYDSARAFMRRTGNRTQWAGGFPPAELLLARIQAGTLYVMEEGTPFAAFALVPGEDPTYASIDGAWMSDAPYATIHQLASDGTHTGVFRECVAFCRSRWDHLRADTHRDNTVMRHLLSADGFVYCGIIRLADGSPRLAYEWSNLLQNDRK